MFVRLGADTSVSCACACLRVCVCAICACIHVCVCVGVYIRIQGQEQTFDVVYRRYVHLPEVFLFSMCLAPFAQVHRRACTQAESVAEVKLLYNLILR